MLTKKYGFDARRASVRRARNYPASNTAAVVTLTAQAERRHVIQGVAWSYSAIPTGGRLSFSDGGTTDWDVDITAAGPGGFSLPFIGGVNAEVVVTLAAGGGSVTGKLNLNYTTESDVSK